MGASRGRGHGPRGKREAPRTPGHLWGFAPDRTGRGASIGNAVLLGLLAQHFEDLIVEGVLALTLLGKLFLDVVVALLVQVGRLLVEVGTLLLDLGEVGLPLGRRLELLQLLGQFGLLELL